MPNRSDELDRPEARLAYLRTRVLCQALHDRGGGTPVGEKPMTHARQTHAYYRTMRLLRRIGNIGRRRQSPVLISTTGMLRRVLREGFRHSAGRRSLLLSTILAMGRMDEVRTRSLLDRLESLGHRIQAPAIVDTIVTWRGGLNSARGHQLAIARASTGESHHDRS